MSFFFPSIFCFINIYACFLELTVAFANNYTIIIIHVTSDSVTSDKISVVIIIEKSIQIKSVLVVVVVVVVEKQRDIILINAHDKYYEKQ